MEPQLNGLDDNDDHDHDADEKLQVAACCKHYVANSWDTPDTILTPLSRRRI